MASEALSSETEWHEDCNVPKVGELPSLLRQWASCAGALASCLLTLAADSFILIIFSYAILVLILLFLPLVSCPLFSDALPLLSAGVGGYPIKSQYCCDISP